MQQLPEPPTVDRGLWIVCKPTGWLVHAANGTDAPDVRTALVAAGAPPDVAPVNRLDLETSGVVLYAETAELRAELGAMFAAGQVAKRYAAVVFGRTRAKGIVRRPLDDGRRGRPLEAVTRYRTREWMGGFSYVALRPEHGRKHQLRRHMQGIGHAIVGDTRYPGPTEIRIPAFPGRLWLHAERIELPDGRSFHAPLPRELAANLEALRAGARDAKGDAPS
ncbi:MAG: RluA family pseudouridine synthase [Myxococcales bacterium]|nr:RluA family pseudouridine synthase [Myxococcales bacterium]MCB9530200.1 RluA family pseudouridine synthase [Myxococcales bacterium]MCB9533713.1 RluA family pseudouridine synthase [Myxococcales bacterium]